MHYIRILPDDRVVVELSPTTSPGDASSTGTSKPISLEVRQPEPVKRQKQARRRVKVQPKR